MVVLLTILSVLAVWAFLLLLVLGLLVIFKALEGVRRHFEQIAMGVRAIERETRPLGDHATALHAGVAAAAGALDGLAGGVGGLGRQIATMGERPPH